MDSDSHNLDEAALLERVDLVFLDRINLTGPSLSAESRSST